MVQKDSHRLLLLLFHFLHAHGQTLTAEMSATKLPHAMQNFASIYDGGDSIFLFGGDTSKIGVTIQEVLRYSISSEQIHHVSTLPRQSYSGSAQMNNEGKFFYFGGFNDGGTSSSYHAFKFDPETNITEDIAIPPHNLRHCGTLKYPWDANSIIVFGGMGNYSGVYEFDTETLNFRELSQLPFGGKLEISAVLPNTNDHTAFIFGRPYNLNSFAPNTFFRLNLDTLDVDIRLPGFSYKDCRLNAVFDGTSIYAIPSYFSSTAGPIHGIFRVNPLTLEHVYLPVENFPVVDGGHFWIPPEAVYVERLNTIYFFGGYASFPGNGLHSVDDIWYLDLNRVTEETMTE